MPKLWQSICSEAKSSSLREPVLASFYYATILNHRSTAAALAFNLALRLDSATIPATLIREVCNQALQADANMRQAIEDDIDAYYSRDPACDQYSMPLLYFKGYQAIQGQRIAHWLWQNQRSAMALYFQHRIACEFDVDIHPAARIGRGIMLDHATGAWWSGKLPSLVTTCQCCTVSVWAVRDAVVAIATRKLVVAS